LLREVVKQHGQRVRIAHRDAPEPGNPASLTAAIAGRCAHRQKRYWPYHDLLYDNQDRLGEPGALQALARQAGLDAPSFDRCLVGRETAREVFWDTMEVRRLGLTELPSLFANSTYIGGVPPLDELTRALESLAL
jgi:protein-disulfide isomerase